MSNVIDCPYKSAGAAAATPTSSENETLTPQVLCAAGTPIASKEWRVEHTPGAQLCADLLTKPVVTTTSWEAFRVAVGLVNIPKKGNLEKVKMLSWYRCIVYSLGTSEGQPSSQDSERCGNSSIHSSAGL